MLMIIEREYLSLHSYLGQVGVGQSLLGRNSPVRVNLQHRLQEVDGHGVGAAEHLIKLLLLHPGQRVDVVLGLNT